MAAGGDLVGTDMVIVMDITVAIAMDIIMDMLMEDGREMSQPTMLGINDREVAIFTEIALMALEILE